MSAIKVEAGSAGDQLKYLYKVPHLPSRLFTGFFLDAIPAPRDPKSADFSSFHLEF